MNIKHVENGYIVEATNGKTYVYPTLEDLFAHLLMHYEGRAYLFGGESYGRVIIERERRSEDANR